MKLVKLNMPVGVESVVIELDPGELAYLAGVAGKVGAGQEFGGRSFYGLFATLDNLAQNHGDHVVASDVRKNVVFAGRK